MSLEQLKEEIASQARGVLVRDQLKNIGYQAHQNQPNVIARAYAIESLFSGCKVPLYQHDRIAGSLLGIVWPQEEALKLPSTPDYAGRIFGERSFVTNYDHYAPDYGSLLDHGIAGVLDKIEKSRSQLKKEMGDYEKKFHFLTAAKISMEAFAGLIGRYGKAAQEQTVPEEYRPAAPADGPGLRAFV